MKPLTNHLLNLVTDRRKELFLSNLEKRTKYLTVVLENIYQPLNASAVLRSCDCFGIQDGMRTPKLQWPLTADRTPNMDSPASGCETPPDGEQPTGRSTQFNPNGLETKVWFSVLQTNAWFCIPFEEYAWFENRRVWWFSHVFDEKTLILAI